MPTPTEQLLSRTLYATDGVTTDWDFSFSGGYLLKSHVKAFTEAPSGARVPVTVTEDMFTGAYQLRITPALADGLTLTIYRDTPKDLPLVDFTDESGFSEISLDTSAKQAVFIGAETIDVVNTSTSYDAEQAAAQAANSAGVASEAAVNAAISANSATLSASTALAAASEAQDTVDILATPVGSTLIGDDDGAGGSLWTTIKGFITRLTSSLGAALVGYISTGAGAVATTVQDKLRTIKVPLDKGIDETGMATCTAALQAMIDETPLDGTIELTPGAFYRITDTVVLNSKHFYCKGKATIIADLNSLVKDAISLSSTVVRGGSAQDYKPAPKLEGILVLVKSSLRDGIRLNGGDYPVWDRVDVQRDPVTAPTWRDGIHVEASASEGWTENLSWRSVRVHDAGRDGFRFEVPAAAWTNTFINVGSFIDCEVRGAGLCEPGKPVHFVSRSTNANNKISQHNFIGGEYQTNNTATNPNPDGFGATKSGTAEIEMITVMGATAECVGTVGTGLAINTTSMEHTTITNFLPYGFNGLDVRGNQLGVGGTGSYIVNGYLGLENYIGKATTTTGLKGGTTAGAPTVDYQIGNYSRVGKIVTYDFEIQISNWGGATGQITLTGLPFNVCAAGGPVGLPWSLNAVTLGAGYTMAVFRGVAGTKTAVLYKLGNAVNRGDVLVSDAGTPFQMAGSMTYHTDEA